MQETVFPRMTSCTFNYFGLSGNKLNVETLCIIPLNIINEKIYVLLWFWLLLVVVVASIHLMLVAANVASSYVRRVGLRQLSPYSSPHVSSRAHLCSVQFAESITVDSA